MQFLNVSKTIYDNAKQTFFSRFFLFLNPDVGWVGRGWMRVEGGHPKPSVSLFKKNETDFFFLSVPYLRKNCLTMAVKTRTGGPFKHSHTDHILLYLYYRLQKGLQPKITYT